MRMRKLLAVLVAAIMVLSVIPAMALTTSAVDVEGDWITYRSANDYDEEQENGSYKPAPGYVYTDDGFQTVGADYTNTMPYFHIMSKETHSLKDGIYLELRVDEFDYNGWISFTLWDSENFSIMDTDGYGSGWSSLINGGSQGNPATVNSSIILEDGNELGEPSFLRNLDNSSAQAKLDDEGKEIFSFEVRYDGSQYSILICDQLVGGCPDITQFFNKISPNGDFYIGIALFSATTGGSANLSILKFGTDKESASTPVGSDSAEAEPNANVFADMMPESGVEENQPALFYNAAEYSTPQVANADVTALGDNAYRFTSRTEDIYFRWLIKNSLSYDAADFPVVAFMVRSYDASCGVLYYCSDDRMSATADYMTSWGLWDEGFMEFTDENDVYYNMVVVDLSEQWSGRINLIRFDFFGLDVGDEDGSTFDFCWAGTFRSVEEAQNYTTAWAKENGLSEEIEDEDTDAPTEAPDVPTEAPVASGEATDAPVVDDKTEAPVVTDAPSKEKEGGCGAVVSVGVTAVLLSAMAAAVALRKKV